MTKVSSFFKTDFDKKRIDAHRINRKADYKLDAVVEGFKKTLGNHFVEAKNELLRKTIYVKGFKHLTSFELNYRAYENRFWAFTYNLDIKAVLDVSDDEFAPDEKWAFTGKTKGKMSVSDIEWLSNNIGCSEEEENIYLKKMNHKLIRSRMTDLDTIKSSVIYDPETRKWTIYMRSMIGSTTWMLIPPVTQLITPHPDEYAKFVECLDMLMSAVTSKELRDYKKQELKKAEKDEN